MCMFISLILNVEVCKIEKNIVSVVGLELPSLTSESWHLNQKSYFSIKHIYMFYSLILNVKVYKIETNIS